jgi:hypothetical protein
MSSQLTSHYLLVALREPLAMTLTLSEPEESITIDGLTFRTRGQDQIQGFYDWLRAADGTLLGVRYTPVGEARELTTAARKLTYARVDEHTSAVEIFFTQQRDADEARSADQAFGGSSVYVAPAGDVLVSFDTYALEETELDALRRRADSSLGVQKA